jgi:hypothetical protein
VPSSLDVSQLDVLHWNGSTWDKVTASYDSTTNTIYASVTSFSPFVIAKLALRAQVQQPINANQTSVFSVKRGVVPVKFTLTSGGVATCQLPPATISLIRNGGTVLGLSRSNFRISNCQYVYNLTTRSLGTGTYKVNISIRRQRGRKRYLCIEIRGSHMSILQLSANDVGRAFA